MRIDAKKTVRDIAVDIPNAGKVFAQLGIDYGNNNRTLWEACTAAGVAVGEVVNMIKKAEADRNGIDRRKTDNRRKPATI